MIWDWMKDKKPLSIALKSRKEGELTIVASEELDICYLNPTASFLLDYCDGSMTMEGILDIFKKEYEVDENTLRNDLIDIVRYMQWKRILKLEE